MVKESLKKFKFFFLILCILQLFYIFHFRSGFKYEVVKDPFSADSGINYAVSPEIIELNNILKEKKLANFSLSKDIKKDTYLYQRSIEFTYPIRNKGNSSFIFFLKDEKTPNNCQVVESGNYVKLVKC